MKRESPFLSQNTLVRNEHLVLILVSIMKSILVDIENWLANPTFSKLLEVVIGVIVILIIFNLLRSFLARNIKDADARYRTRKALSIISYLFILIFSAITFSSSLGKLTIFFGAIGAGIAFALQEVIGSFAGWMAISLGQFYKPGNRVQLGGIMGDVIDIGFLRTTLMECGDWVKADLYNGRIVRIANSFVFKEPVFNYSADFPFLWDEITVPIRHGSDRKLTVEILSRVVNEVCKDYVPQAKAEWQKMVHKYLIEDAQIEPMVTLVVNDNWLEYKIRYIVHYKHRLGKKSELFNRILDEMDKSNGRVNVASSTFELVHVPSLNVKFSRHNIAP